MAESCLFCRIVAGELPAQVVYASETVLAFRDIHPQAPLHILIIPRQHVADLALLDETTAPFMADLFLAVKAVIQQEGVAGSGYRLVINQGRDGGQEIAHLHLHLLAGRRLRWPPG